MSEKNIRRGSLEEIKEMGRRGEFLTNPNPTHPEGEELPPDFWDSAVWVEPQRPQSVHLKLEPDVYDFFKRQGKGHITRMQNVLKAYVRAKTGT
jgi:uncharacterized protein (DUF4415 family)